MNGKTFKVVGRDISDGYHTFDELYEHRNHLFMALCSLDPIACFWKKDDSTPGWAIVYWESVEGQISYHVKMDMTFDLFITRSGAKCDPEHKWDGHTSKDAITRLFRVIQRGVRQ